MMAPEIAAEAMRT
jgi:site-specific DNA recombinase